jgi:hypothetical protein
LLPNPSHQAFGHLVVLIDFLDDGHKGFTAGQTNQPWRVEVNHDPLPMARQVADEHGATAVPLDAIKFAAMWAEAGDGRRLCFDVALIFKLLPVEFSEAGEVQDASHFAVSDVKNPRQFCAGVELKR